MRETTIVFDCRNKEKKNIHKYGATKKKRQFYIKQKEIWYIKLGVNIGYEQNGKTEFKRAVLVLKQIGNLFLILPMTTKEKKNIYHYKILSFDKKQSRLILSQIRTIDKKRFIEKIGEIKNNELKIIKKNLSSYYFSDLGL